MHHAISQFVDLPVPEIIVLLKFCVGLRTPNVGVKETIREGTV